MGGPGNFSIEKATAEDATKIRSLILRSAINPTALDWRRFVVARTAPEREFIGCGQIKLHADGTHELASIAVVPEWRGRGVGRAVIEALLAAHTGELYLMCQSSLGGLYTRFGFYELNEEKMPKYFRRVSKLAGVLENLSQAGEHLLVMYRPLQ
ncbi:MAG: GNAT family N-acetyltransferase [Anaerolineales bacterium]